jgi:hypothetical protein
VFTLKFFKMETVRVRFSPAPGFLPGAGISAEHVFRGFIGKALYAEQIFAAGF